MKTSKSYDFLLKLYRTVRLNAFYILLSLLVPVILWKVQVGRDIIISLTETDGRSYFNIPLLIAAFSLLALSNWAIPVLAIDIWRVVLRRRVKSQMLYIDLIGLYNGMKVNKRAQFPIRYFASLPWVIFLYVAVYALFPGRTIYAAVSVVLLISLIVIIDWVYGSGRIPVTFQRVSTSATQVIGSDKAKAVRYVAIMSFLFLLYLAVVGLIGFWLREHKEGLAILVIIANIIAILANYAYMKFAENVDLRGTCTSYFVSKYIHILSLLFMLVVAMLLQSSNSAGWPIEIGFFSPIFVLIIAISIYLFLADVLITAQLNITQIYNSDPEKYDERSAPGKGQSVWVWYRPAIRLMACGFLFLFFFNSINSHRIRNEEVQPGRRHIPSERPALTVYFDRWVQNRITAGNDTLDVYLVSGQGGGSRAAVWFFMAMNYLDSLASTPSHRFADHVFSISTVSGSTSGAAMYLADRQLGIPPQPTSVVPRMKAMYARNYLSSSFWGALIGDGYEGFKHEVIDRISGKRGAFPKDRNYYFQQEEAQGYTDATSNVTRDDVSAFFESDYLFSYLAKQQDGQPAQQDSLPALNTKLPLFFINSAIVETGERGVFAPVDLAGFSLATDLYGLFRKHRPNHSIPLITCVNQSQAFPIINAYNYLDGAGRLLDGGIYENSGTTTTLEIYETLRWHVATHYDTLQAIRFICINIVNTNMDATEDTVRFRPASVLNTLTAAFKSPFGGHEQFSYRNIMRRVTAPDTAYSFPLNKPVPLTRMLQPAAIDTMYAALRGTAVAPALKK